MKRKTVMKYNLSYALVIFSSLFSIQSFAFDSTPLLQKLQLCAQITIDEKRLFCFDNLSQKKLKTEIKPTELKAAEPNIIVTPEVLVTPEIIDAKKNNEPTDKQIDNFSKELVKKTTAEKAEEITSLTVTISALKKLMRGSWVITFNNGQKWQQKGSERIKLKVGELVILKKGLLTSVFLHKQNSNRSIKIKRLQ